MMDVTISTYDNAIHPNERVSLIRCEECHVELAKLEWKNFFHDSSDGYMAVIDAELAIYDAHKFRCSK